jgi:hypothetical protein
MSDRTPPARFMVRQGTRGYMIWDREQRGPATIGGQLQVGLAQEQAEMIRDSLEVFYAVDIGRAHE